LELKVEEEGFGGKVEKTRNGVRTQLSLEEESLFSLLLAMLSLSLYFYFLNKHMYVLFLKLD
jgi:hypothetical protein